MLAGWGSGGRVIASTVAPAEIELEGTVMREEGRVGQIQGRQP